MAVKLKNIYTLYIFFILHGEKFVRHNSKILFAGRLSVAVAT